MGFFKDLVSDITFIGSPTNAFRKKLTELISLLTKYTYGQLQLSDNLAREKIALTFRELKEVSHTIANKEEYFKMYDTHGDIETNIPQALKAAEFCIQACLEENQKLSYKLLFHAFEKFKSF